MTPTQPTPRKTIAVLFGGRSAEHEISVISGLQLIQAMDVLRYRPVPVYIDQEGRWFTGDALYNKQFYKRLPASRGEAQEVTLLPKPGARGLTVIDQGKVTNEVLPIDIFLLCFHGQFGEDGCIQGLMELADVPYTGCNLVSSAVAMNKYLCKMFLKAHDIPVLPSVLLEKSASMKDLASAAAAVRRTPGLENFPLFIKPNNLGSSIGIGKAQNDQELKACLAKVFKYDFQAIVEPCLQDMFEINISVIDTGEATTSVVEIPVSSGGALSYEDKYMRGGKSKKGNDASSGMASLTRIIDPQDLGEGFKTAVTNYARKSFNALGCSGIVRFDFMVDKNSGQIYFNELNTIPGSLGFYLWVKSKPLRLYTENITTLIERAEWTHQMKSSLLRDTGFRAMFG